MIDIVNLHKRHGNREILKGVSLKIQQREVLVLLGASGAGKSTLLRCVNGLESFDQGTISIASETIAPDSFRRRDARESLRRVRRNVGMVFQSFCLFPHLSALDNVALAPRRVLGLPRDEAERRARQLLGQVHLQGRESQLPRSLSGGEQQRVAIARALAMQPEALLFDEPTSSLDPELVGEVLAVIEELAQSGYTMVIVTHQMHFARRCATRVALLDAGVVVEEAPTEEFFTAPRSDRARAFLTHFDGGG
ncbi:MAG: amino acid ABC transporter ATP-binding protein [Acidobacteriota bacterium]